MLRPVTIISTDTSPRKLQKDQSPRDSYRHSFRYISPRRSSLAHGSRKENTNPPCFDGVGGPGMYSNRSSLSTTGSSIGAHPSTTRSLRVHTKGALLTSGFPYHPGLSDLRVHRIMWEKFTNQIIGSVKLSSAERAKVWAVSTAAVVATSDNYLVARNKSQQILEDKVKEGLVATAPGSLGYIIREWNEGYFAERGLVARVELAESSPLAQRRGRLPQKMHLRRIQAERKFSIVVARQWDPEDIPPEALRSSSLASCTSPQHSDRGTPGESACSPYSTDFKPLPGFPLHSDPRLDMAAELSHLTVAPSPEPPQANQFAELEGDAELGQREGQENLGWPSADELPEMGSFDTDDDRLPQPETRERALAEVLTALKAMSPKQEQCGEHAGMTNHHQGHANLVLDHIPDGDGRPSRDSSIIDCNPNSPFAEDRDGTRKVHPAHRKLCDDNIGDVRAPIEVTVVDDCGENERFREHHQGGTTWRSDWPLELDDCSREDGNKHSDQSTWDVWDSRPNWPLGETISPSLLTDDVRASYMPSVTNAKSNHSRERSTSSDQPRYELMSRRKDHDSSGNIDRSERTRPSNSPQWTRRKVSVEHAPEPQPPQTETFAKPMRSPSASFFLPLDIKAISTSLDFDARLRAKDMAMMF
ncbi:hypothetical protein CERZMDRAFT_101665 [Cercospora zeae-maydis SCOH1-5]|uniref:Uncharacterized protein n=1 Tax=Cercospora zeae-maydis SCOH1-5 TaxID=717836 RepID=A0A6A6F3A4_9PEZI|nr:hypothetical protein CERZMDRAFT_101665 [Cercospora zeae-maydis SCOH1-5]